MTNRRVRAGASYVFQPVPYDRANPPANMPDLAPGSVVKVVNLPGCPKANTMGMCHIEFNGTFAGMVCTNSLQPRKRERKTDDQFIVQTNYGQGWEDSTTETKWSEGVKRLREYRQNQPEYRHRLDIRRVKKTPAQ